MTTFFFIIIGILYITTFYFIYLLGSNRGIRGIYRPCHYCGKENSKELQGVLICFDCLRNICKRKN